MSRALIIGVGNKLMGDDGFGSYLVNVMRKHCVGSVEFVDLEVRSIDLVSVVSGSDLVIVVDIAKDLEKNIEVYRVDVKSVTNDDVLSITDDVHGVRPFNALVMAYLSGLFNGIAYLILIRPSRIEYWKGISKNVIALAPLVIDEILSLLKKYGISCRCNLVNIIKSLCRFSIFSLENLFSDV